MMYMRRGPFDVTLTNKWKNNEKKPAPQQEGVDVFLDMAVRAFEKKRPKKQSVSATLDKFLSKPKHADWAESFKLSREDILHHVASTDQKVFIDLVRTEVDRRPSDESVEVAVSSLLMDSKWREASQSHGLSMAGIVSILLPQHAQNCEPA